MIFEINAQKITDGSVITYTYNSRSNYIKKGNVPCDFWNMDKFRNLINKKYENAICRQEIEPKPTVDSFCIEVGDESKIAQVINGISKRKKESGTTTVHLMNTKNNINNGIKVYIEEIKKNLQKTNFVLHTQGGNLNSDMVDYLVKERVSCAFYHKGLSEQRTEDPLEIPETRKAWVRYYYIARQDNIQVWIRCPITKRNINLEELREFYDNRLGPRIDIEIYEDRGIDEHEKINSTNEIAAFEDSVIIALTRDWDRWQSLAKKATEVLSAIVNSKPTNEIITECDMCGKNKINIDSNGNETGCSKYQIQRTSRINWNKRINCGDCYLLTVCKGSCPVANDESFDKYCKGSKILSKAIFNAVWFFLTETVIVDIKKKTNNG